MTDPARALHLFDVEHGVHASARAGATLLFEGTGSTALPTGPRVEATAGGWRAELEGRFAVELEPVAGPAELDGVTAHVCAVGGELAGRRVSCLGTVAETTAPPEWDGLDAVRSLSALFDRDDAFLAVAQRPRGARGHDAERTAAWLLRAGAPVELERVRLSTVYDGDGRQRSAGVELWTPLDEHPLRLSGTVVAGSSLALEAVDVHAAVFRWRLGDREGSGSYELMARSRSEAA